MGVYYREYVDHGFNHAPFCMYGNGALAKTVYLKVLKKETASIGL